MICTEVEEIYAIGALTYILIKYDKQDVHITLAGSDASRLDLSAGRELTLILKQIYVFSRDKLARYSI